MISEGTFLSKVDNTDAVMSVNGRLGNIIILSSDITNGLGYTPSNITNSVPYSGSINNVDLGTYSLTTDNINIKKISLIDKNSGLYSTEELDNGEYQVILPGYSGYKFNFQSLNSVRTYTYPDKDGTIAMTSDLTPYALTATLSNYQKLLTNPITGTGTSGKIALFNGTSSITGANLLYWDNVNNYLGIGVTTPLKPIHISGNTSNGIALFNRQTTNNYSYYTTYIIQATPNANTTAAQGFGPSMDYYFATQSGVIGNFMGALTFRREATDNSSFFQLINFSGGSQYANIHLFSNGNLLLSHVLLTTTPTYATDTGYRLDVDGTLRVRGTASINNIVSIGTQSGMVINSLTYAQRIALTPVVGTICYQNNTSGGSTEGYYCYKSSGWVQWI